MKRIQIGFWGSWIFLSCLTWSETVHAHHLLKDYALSCDSHFPCPKELVRRVAFWIDIFHEYSIHQAVFHDLEHPDRLFSFLNSNAPCTKRREPKAITDEKKRLREMLLEVARRIDANETTWTEDETHLLRIYSAQPEDMREGAENVRCQMGNKERFFEALKRWGRYRDMVTKTLKQAGLSDDLQYLPFVESSYNPKAFSRVGAAGIWQIMPRTARLLGLKINDTVDERLDPELATKAAAKYFKNSYEELTNVAASLGDGNSSLSSGTPAELGPFVVTSYNYGTAGMRKALREMGPDFVKVLYEFGGRRFHIAVKNFYASFLAARFVAQNAEKFFGPVVHQAPLEYDLVTVERPTSIQRLSTHFKVSLDELRDLNPSLTERVYKGRRLVPSQFVLRLPKGKKPEPTLVAELTQLPAERLKLGPESYRVERGDSLIRISREFKVTLKDLMAANSMTAGSKIRIGQVITIPGRGEIVTEAPAIKVAAKPPVVPPPTTAAIGLKVMIDAEETLDLYAEWLGHKNTKILETVNKLEGANDLPLGKSIEIPVKTEDEKKEFESKRAGFHQTLQDEFKDHFDIIGQEVYKLAENESVNPKEIASKLDVPLWLFLQFNPEVSTRPIKPGDVVNYPVLIERSEEGASQELDSPLREPAVDRNVGDR